MVRLLLSVAALTYANEPLLVQSVVITGAGLQVNLETQVGRPYDASAVERDVLYLYSSRPL